MESTNDNNDQMLFVFELKELRNELSAVKKRINQLEKSHEKQQEKINMLESENNALKTELDLNLKSKSTSVSVSAGKKTKTNNNNDNNDDDDETVVISRYDNGDSFDSLSDDLLHKIVEFDGNCYSKFGSINKRFKNIYDVKEYKLKKQTCVYGYGTLDMMLERYLQKRREGRLDFSLRLRIADAVVIYNRLDVIDWTIQLEDSKLLRLVCCFAARYGRIKILKRVFLQSNVTMLDKILDDDGSLCSQAAYYGRLETLKWLRSHGAEWDADTFDAARDGGYDEIVQYLRAEGCPEPPEYSDESSESEQVGSDEEDGDGDY